MGIVLDVSAIISLAFPDEDPAYAKAVLDAIDADRAVVPTLFWFELRNALLVGERRGRSNANQTAAFLTALSLLPFEVDDRPLEASVYSLARQYSLTFYDAAYLELAQRKSLSIATVDRALIAASTHAGVRVWSKP